MQSGIDAYSKFTSEPEDVILKAWTTILTEGQRAIVKEIPDHLERVKETLQNRAQSSVSHEASKT